MLETLQTASQDSLELPAWNKLAADLGNCGRAKTAVVVAGGSEESSIDAGANPGKERSASGGPVSGTERMEGARWEESGLF